MWEIDDSTGYAAGRNWIRDKDAVHLWLVAVRATFDIDEKGQLAPAQEQREPLLEPQFRGDPGMTSLVMDSDLLAQKPGTDIVLDARAFAPKGRPQTIVEASLRVAGLSKTVIVHGPRVYKSGKFGVTPTSSHPFVSLPIHYEWAYGGADLSGPDPARWRMDDRNPVGKGVAVRAADLYDQPAHLVEYPGRDPATAGPAGFGPIASAWMPRRARAGTYDARWERTKKPFLPDDYKPAFALSAPDDQRPPGHLKGGEPVLVTNMTPEGTLRFDLPRIWFGFETVFRGRAVRHEGTLTTVFLTPHERKVSLVWQSAIKVRAHETEYLDYTLITEEPFP